MKKKIMFILFIILTIFSFSNKNIKLNDEIYSLNGSGIRKKAFIKLYSISFFSRNKITNMESSLNNKENMVITLEIISSLIGSKQMQSAIEEGFQKSLSKEDYVLLKSEIENFKNSFSLEEIKKGDKFQFISQGESIISFKNGKKIITVKNNKFRIGLFSIWLGKNPINENLQKELLNIE